MNPQAFDLLCAILRMRNGPMRHGARLVLVEGMRPGDAAACLQCAEQSIRNAVQRMRRGRDSVLAAALALSQKVK